MRCSTQSASEANLPHDATTASVINSRANICLQKSATWYRLLKIVKIGTNSDLHLVLDQLLVGPCIQYPGLCVEPAVGTHIMGPSTRAVNFLLSDSGLCQQLLEKGRPQLFHMRATRHPKITSEVATTSKMFRPIESTCYFSVIFHAIKTWRAENLLLHRLTPCINRLRMEVDDQRVGGCCAIKAELVQCHKGWVLVVLNALLHGQW
mmetsp:Transcript_30287/g.100459  ORF Transcript_30287/g.100459 Transcript_30287/m.100459 type:complete len:207 (-) Transcript_30287:512-1132(-)